MGKAHQAPPSHKPRYRYVAEHAIERLRERIRELDISHRIDSDLVHWLDQSVEQAIRRGDVKVFDDRGEITRLVDITSDLDAPTFVVVKRNARSDSDFGEALVTVLNESMVQKYKGERWKDPGFGSLAEKFVGVTIGPAPTKPVDPPTSTPKLVAAEANVDPDEVILIEYRKHQNIQGDGVTYEKIKRSELQHRLLEIALAGDDASQVRFWRETKAQAKLAVSIEGL